MKIAVLQFLFAGFLLFGGLQGVVIAQTSTSAQSGNYNDGSTWVGGNVPANGNNIIIKIGHTVTLDVAGRSVHDITIEAGAIFDNGDFDLTIFRSSGNPTYKNDGIHNSGTGNLILFNNFYTRVRGTGVSNINFNVRDYGIQPLFDCDLTINGNLQYHNNVTFGSKILIYNSEGGTITINGNIVPHPEKGITIINENWETYEASITVNGDADLSSIDSFSGEGTNFTNEGAFTVTGDLIISPGFGYIENNGVVTIGGDLLGGSSGDDWESLFVNEGLLKLGGNVFPAAPYLGNLAVGLNSTVEYIGNSHQTIFNPWDENFEPGGSYNNLIIINSSEAGLNMASDITVTGSLGLLNGFLHLEDKNLTLDTSATISGTPSAGNMIVANSSGEVRKIFTNPGSFTFPIGDNTGTAEYSPVTLNFASGTFTDGYAGVNLVNAAYPGASGSYLNRYWNISSSGITDFACNTQFDYVPADVTGIESNLYCYRVAPTVDQYDVANTSLHQLTANGLTSFGTFTGRELYNPDFPLAYTVTGGGSYCEGSDGREVGLTGSELTVTYTLFKNDVAQSPTIAGSGSAISFGNQLSGTYTVTGTNDSGTTLMTGNAVITENATVTPGVTITPDANFVCAGTYITIVATTVNGGDTPDYQWFVNGIESGDNNPDFTYLPENEDMVSLILTSSELCTNENPVESNTLILSVNALPEVSWTAFVPDTLCENGSPVALTGGIPEGGTYSGIGVTNNTFNPAIAGSGAHDIIYTFTDGNNCSGQAAYSLFVEVCTSVNNPGSDRFSLFPNPASERFTIKTAGQHIEEIALFNSLGNLIIERKGLNKANAVSVSVDGFAAGVYFVRIKCLEGFFVKLVTVQ
jgi:hypothetical protein